MKHKRLWVLVWLTTLLTVFIATLVNNRPYLLMGGSSSVAPLMQELLAKYPQNHKDVDFNYVSSASSGAPPRVQSNMFGIGWLSKDYQSQKPKEMFTFQLMRDGLVIVYNLNGYINPNAGPLNFNETTVQKLYLYHQSWQEVFGKEIITKDIKPKLFTRPNGSGTRDVFDEKCLNKTSFYQANTIDSSSAMLNLDVGGIGYSSFADINQATKLGVSVANWYGVAASYETIAGTNPDPKENYSLWRPFIGLINRNYPMKPPLKVFLNWVFSNNSTAVKIFSKYGPRTNLDKNKELKEWLS